MKYLFIAILMITTTSAFAVKCKDFRTHAQAKHTLMRKSQDISVLTEIKMAVHVIAFLVAMVHTALGENNKNEGLADNRIL